MAKTEVRVHSPEAKVSFNMYILTNKVLSKYLIST